MWVCPKCVCVCTHNIKSRQKSIKKRKPHTHQINKKNTHRIATESHFIYYNLSKFCKNRIENLVDQIKYGNNDQNVKKDLLQTIKILLNQYTYGQIFRWNDTQKWIQCEYNMIILIMWCLPAVFRLHNVYGDRFWSVNMVSFEWVIALHR